MTFRGALGISLVVHSLAISPLAVMKTAGEIPAPERKKPLEVDYIKVKETLKTQETAPVPLARKIDLQPPAPVAPQAPKKVEAERDALKEAAAKTAEVKSTKDYINYHQLLREKIRRALKENYANYSGEGDVLVEFVLNSDGSLAGWRIDDKNLTEDGKLIDIAVRSLREAAPFPAFPKALTLSHASFNVTVSFRKR